MRLLLDTHFLLWVDNDPNKIKPKLKNYIEDYNNQLFVSAASLYEIIQKYNNGKLPKAKQFVENQKETLKNLAITVLDVTSQHFTYAANFNWPTNQDPFDRIIVAQAICENLTLVSNDHKLDELPEVWHIC